MRLVMALGLIPALSGCSWIERVLPFDLTPQSVFELQKSCQGPARGPSDWQACQNAKASRVAERFSEESFEGYDAVIIDGEMAVDSEGNVIVFDYPAY